MSLSRFLSRVIVVVIIAVFVSLLCPQASEAAPEAAERLRPSRFRSGVMPEPQRVFEVAGAKPFQLSKDVSVIVGSDDDRFAAEVLILHLKDVAGIELAISRADTPSGDRPYIFIGRSNAAQTADGWAPIRAEFGDTRAEGYHLLVNNQRIVIDAHDTRGALYGVQTLRQLIRQDLNVGPIAITDWPEMPLRSTYGGFAGGINDRADIERFVTSASMAKLNMVILESPWSGHANWWFNPDGGRGELAAYFMELCRRYQIEPVPLVQGAGWGYGVTDRDVMTAEGIWIENEKVILQADHTTELAKRNVIVTEMAPILVRSEDSGTLYKEDVDYRVVPGETGRPYPETNKAWGLQLIAGGQIKDGQRVSVSYNHVTPNAHKAYCLSEPRADKIALDVIDQVMTMHRPKVIHLGFDEVWDLGTDSRCLQSGKSPEQLVFDHVMLRYQRVKQHDPDAVVMIWDDLLRPTRGGVSNGILNGFIDRLPKDIVVCPWLYHVKEDDKVELLKRVKHLTEAGFPIVGTPSGYWMSNNLDWYKAVAPHVSGGLARGMMFTDWGGGLNASCTSAAAELMWSGRRTVVPMFEQLEAITNRLKQRGLALSFPLRTQGKAIAKLFDDEIVAGTAPAAVAERFAREVCGDDALFRHHFGKARWDEMENIPVHMNHYAMVRRIPAFVTQVARYLEAEYSLSQGNRDAAGEALRDVIVRLHRLGYLTQAQANELATQAKTRWLTAEELLGFHLSPYRTAARGQVDGVVTPVDPAEWTFDRRENENQLVFKRPVAVLRIESARFADAEVSVQPGATDAPVVVRAHNGVLTLQGEAIRSVTWTGSGSEADVRVFAVRPAAKVSSSFAAEPPPLTTRFDMSAWQQAARVSGFITQEGMQASSQTEVLLTHDRENLYIGFMCHHVPGTPLQTNAPSVPLWEDDSVELFFDTDRDGKTFHQIIINAAGTFWEKGETTGESWQSKARIETRREEEAWFVAVAIPFATLIGQPRLAAAQEWRVNFTRTQLSPELVNSTWAPLAPGNADFFLQPANFGTMELPVKE